MDSPSKAGAFFRTSIIMSDIALQTTSAKISQYAWAIISLLVIIVPSIKPDEIFVY